MKKLTKIALCVLLVGATSFTKSVNQSDVYICGPNGAERYHLVKNCRGLSNCKHDVYKVTLSSAKSKKLTLCGWED